MKVWVIGVIEGYEDFSIGEVFATFEDAQKFLRDNGWIPCRRGSNNYQNPKIYNQLRTVNERVVLPEEEER